MSNDQWKEVEREIAKLLGGERVPVSGRARGYAPDIEQPWLSIEVKDRKKLPDWQKDGMRQALASAKPGQLPIVIFHEKGARYLDSMVQIRLGDFIDWFGDNRGNGED